MADEQDVIDWDEAMEQCGGDEEFLHELLGDLKEELETQIKKIEAAMVSLLFFFSEIRRRTFSQVISSRTSQLSIMHIVRSKFFLTLFLCSKFAIEAQSSPTKY